MGKSGSGTVFENDPNYVHSFIVSQGIGEGVFTIIKDTGGLAATGPADHCYFQEIVYAVKKVSGVSTISIAGITSESPLSSNRIEGTYDPRTILSPNYVGTFPDDTALDSSSQWKDGGAAIEKIGYYNTADDAAGLGEEGHISNPNFIAGNFTRETWNQLVGNQTAKPELGVALQQFRRRAITGDGFAQVIDATMKTFKLKPSLSEFNSELPSVVLNDDTVYFPVCIIYNKGNPTQSIEIDNIVNMEKDTSLIDFQRLFKNIHTKFWDPEGSSGFINTHLAAAPNISEGANSLFNWGGDKPFVFLPHINTNNDINTEYENSKINKIIKNAKGYEIDSKLRQRIEDFEDEEGEEESKEGEDKKPGGIKLGKPKKSPEQIRKELGAEVRSYKAAGREAVPFTPDRSSRGNTYIVDQSLAYYCYLWDENLAKKYAPDFYSGMWSGAEGPGGRINGRIENPNEHVTLSNAIVKDAYKNKRGIFGNSKYRKAIESKLGKDSSKWPKGWIDSGGETGLGVAIGSIPGLEAYHPGNDRGSGFSDALFYKDLTNGMKEPSSPGIGKAYYSTNTTSSKSGSKSTGSKSKAPAGSPSAKPGSKQIKNIQPKVTPSADFNENKFIIIKRPKSHPLYDFISKEEIESILTDAAPTDTAADYNTRADVTLVFSRRGKLKKVKTSSNIGRVITTDDHLFNRSISAFKRRVKRDISSAIEGQSSEISKLGIKNVRFTIKNFSGARRLEESQKERVLKHIIKVSKAFKK